MRLDDELRGRRTTRPDTPRIITDRERQRIGYHARDLVDAWAMTTLANCRTRAKLLGITCTLTLPDLIELLIESDLTCRASTFHCALVVVSDTPPIAASALIGSTTAVGIPVPTAYDLLML